MTKIEKLTEKFVANPSSFRYKQIEKILLSIGFTKIPTKGSHTKWKHHQLKYDLIIPIHNNDCKDFYKNLIAKNIQKNNLYPHP